MGYTFRDWLSCPNCERQETARMMTHKTDFVLECYDCGQMSEYTIGKDMPLQNLDIDAVSEIMHEE